MSSCNACSHLSLHHLNLRRHWVVTGVDPDHHDLICHYHWKSTLVNSCNYGSYVTQRFSAMKWLCRAALLSLDLLVKIDLVFFIAVHAVPETPCYLVKAWAAKCVYQYIAVSPSSAWSSSQTVKIGMTMMMVTMH